MKTSFAGTTLTGDSIAKVRGEFDARVQQLTTTKAITNDGELEAVTLVVRAQKELRKEIQDHHAPMKEQANTLHKTICAQENTLVRPLTEAIIANERSMGRYIQERDRKRQDEQQRIQQAETERFTKQIEKAAVKLDKAGKPEEAQDLREAAARNLPQVQLAPAVTPKGVRPPKPEYTFEIEDARKIPAEWLLPADEKQRDPDSYPRIKAYVKSLGAGAQIPGIKVVTKDPKASVR